MATITLASPVDLAGFRISARDLVRRGIPPPNVVWRVAGDPQDHLALDEPLPASKPSPEMAELRVPRSFLALAEAVICHSDPGRFALLYRLLWRLRSERQLMEIPSDPDLAAALRLEKSVGRDVHKMHAFVRFRELVTPDGSSFVAWFEPEHFIEERAAPFFAKRFAGLAWTIVTPRVTTTWNGETLHFGPGGRREDVPAEDASEALWLAYYRSIFNPARLKVKAMTAEMPKKYWRNLPEARAIPGLIAGAEARVRGMIAAAPTEVPRRAERVKTRIAAMDETDPSALSNLQALRAEAEHCQRCPLFANATQTVFGEGPDRAEIMVVGEQPGDREDLAGRPFVGPAGEVFNQAIEEAGIPREQLYVTNAVKHFKNEPRGKRRLHKKPNGAEIEACRWWLAQEISLIAPKLIVGMGGTALQSLLDRPVKILELRGRFIEEGNAPPIFATIHPSFILRLPDRALRETERRRFVDDLKRVAERMAAMG
jgi:DNA polymerase